MDLTLIFKMSRNGLAKWQRRVFQTAEKLSDAQVFRLEETPENLKDGGREASEKDIALGEGADTGRRQSERMLGDSLRV